MKNLFVSSAGKLYRWLEPILFKNRNQKVLRALRQLYPRKNEEKLYEEYQIRKLLFVSAILVIGAVSAVLIHLSSRMEEKLAEGTHLIRNEWGVGDYWITLLADVDDWHGEFPFLVKERQFSEEERIKLLDKLDKELPELIRKNNQDLQHVTDDLNLVSSVEGYPFKLSWRSENGERINQEGKVNLAGIEGSGEMVTLTVKISCQGESAGLSYEVFLLPETLSEQESFFRKLSSSLSQMDSRGANQKILSLPLSLDGKDIVWKEKGADGGILLIFFTLACCTFVGRGMESDLQKNCRKREKQLLMDYSGFISKLRLYLSAGLTTKNALIRIVSDYESQNIRGKIHYLYEEMKISCYQLENGVTEEQVYQDFGRRCGGTQYRRLGFLLSVHLKQGNNRLLEILSQEADSAQEDERNMAKRMGEEAGTRLLLPMMLMLIFIMFLVLLPVYMDFGNI